MHVVLEGISLFLQAFWGFGDGLLKTIWENIPVFIKLKSTLGYVSLEGIFAICMGVPLFLVNITSWGLRKVFDKR